MVSKRAGELNIGDVFAMHIYAEVIAAMPVAGGKRIKIKIELENQGHRSFGSSGFAAGDSSLEFTDAGHVLEFLCRPSRKFHVHDSDGDGADTPTPPTPVAAE